MFVCVCVYALLPVIKYSYLHKLKPYDLDGSLDVLHQWRAGKFLTTGSLGKKSMHTFIYTCSFYILLIQRMCSTQFTNKDKISNTLVNSIELIDFHRMFLLICAECLYL